MPPGIFLRLAAVALAALLPASARADAVLNECSQAALESALLQGGRITVNCDGTLLLTNTITVATDAVLDATNHRLTISGDGGTNAVRLFNVAPGVSFTLINLTLAGGRGTNGGAIYNNRGWLTNDSCVFSNNIAIGAGGRDGSPGSDSDFQVGRRGGGGGGGRPAFGGAIYNFRGTTVVNRCTFLTNAAFGGGGGNGGNGGSGPALGGNGGNGGAGAKAQGGAIFNSGFLYVDVSTFQFNHATGGAGGAGGTNGSGFAASHPGHGASGGLASGGAIYNTNGARLTVYNSTFALNQARGGDSAPGGGNSGVRGRNGQTGPAAFGGAITSLGTNVVGNSTFFANKTTGGAGGAGAAGDARGGNGGAGGTAWGGNIYNGRHTALTNCTFFDGGATGGAGGAGGAAIVAGRNGGRGPSRGGNVANGNGRFSLANTLIAFALPGTNGYGAFTDFGYNLSSDRSIRLRGPGSMTNRDPVIGLLGRNGGPTETIPLLSGSPAINAGSFGGYLIYDQRGVARPVEDRPDIGAYEAGITLLPPTITTHPLSQVAQAGATITFLVVVNGDPPITYQWQRNGTAIAGANGPVLTLNNVQSGDATTYNCVVANNSGSTTSSNATLTLVNRVAISTQPASTNLVQGDTAVFRVAATGDGPLSYQWLYNRTSFVAGATLTTLTLPNLATNDAGEYSVRVSNPFSSITSAVAVLTIGTVAPAITEQPQNLTVLPDTSASFTVGASGSLPLQFLWFHHGTNLVGSFLLNTNRSTLTLLNVQPANAGAYHAVITNISGAATSDSAALAVEAFPPTIGQQPTNLTVIQGAVATFRVSAAGTTPIFYQWFFNGATPVPGGTGPVLTIANADLDDEGAYHCVVSNRFGAVPSDFAMLTVMLSPPVITDAPTNRTVFSGETVTFTVAAIGSTPLTYQWFFNDTLIDGAIGVSLTISNASSATDSGDYYVVVSNPLGSTNSEPATLSVLDSPPEFTLQPTNETVFRGSNVTFTVAATGSLPLSYQWLFNGEEIPGATNATLTITNVAYTNAGTYDVMVTNPLDSVNSDDVTLMVLAPFTLTCPPGDPLICTITVASEEGVDYTLQYFDEDLMEWFTIETLPGTGGNISFTDAPSGTTAPPYRVLAEPVPPVE